MSTRIELSKCDYDLENDSVFFYGTNETCKKSIDLNDIILDLNKDGYVIAIEILDASEKFKVSKTELQKIKSFIADIEINEDIIKIEMKIGLIERDKSLEAVGLNNYNLPISNQGIALCY